MAKTELGGKNSVDLSLEDKTTADTNKKINWKDDFSDYIINLCTLSIYQKIAKEITSFPHSPTSKLPTSKSCSALDKILSEFLSAL